VIEGFRWCLLGEGHSLPTTALLTSVLVTALLLAFSLHYFRRVEKSFADVI
jgi:lipopolysaccharide transport system permease protein